ncbi:hypothetical protein B0H14DRAFT_3474169 [Mycena olivaceomarginata]|nr:hypothetical protein B0H14DRAFT_3474169 [Mycena olivaceomarginata]
MPCTTRSATRLAYLDVSDIEPSPQTFEIICLRSTLALIPHIQEAMYAADRRAAGEEEDEEWEDVDVEISSRPPTPLSRSPSPLTDAPSSRAPSPELESGRSSPLSDIPPSRLPSPARPSPVDSWKLRQKGGKKKRQQRARQKAAQTAPFGPPPKAIHSQAHRERPRHETTFNAKDVRAVSGAWTGLRATKRPRTRKLRHRRKWTLRALEEDDCEVIEWNGRDELTGSKKAGCAMTVGYVTARTALHAAVRISSSIIPTA